MVHSGEQLARHQSDHPDRVKLDCGLITQSAPSILQNVSGTEKCQTEKWFHSVPEGKHKTLTHKISGNLFDKFIRETSQTLIRPRFQIKATTW